MDTKRERLSSRLGFLLVSAGCAIGLGNIWRFPYITGKYGGAAFVIIYIISLLVVGIPILIMEFSIGRAGQRGQYGHAAPGTQGQQCVEQVKTKPDGSRRLLYRMRHGAAGGVRAGAGAL